MSILTKVVNLAAQAGVRYSIENPYAYVESNIDKFLECIGGLPSLSSETFGLRQFSSVYWLNGKVPFQKKTASHL